MGLIEWFWRGSALAEAKKASAEPTERGVELALRAHASAELARNVLLPQESPEAHFEGYACELYRQSIYWSLCALAARAGSEPGSGYEPAIWDSLESPSLAAAGERGERLKSELRTATFVQFAELPLAERVTTCGELRTLAHELLATLDRRAEILSAIYLERTLRVVGLVVVILALLGGGVKLASELRLHSDLAYGKQWVASSRYGHEGCISPSQQCSDSGYFFHTNEQDNPWIEFDLGAEKTVSRVDVTNRTTCCSERAAPLTIEVSSNHQDWRSVAQRDADFAEWTASFSPVQARWVRLRLRSRNYLHLSHVGIH